MTAHQPSKRQWIKGAAATVGTLAVAPQLWAQGSSAAPIAPKPAAPSANRNTR